MFCHWFDSIQNSQQIHFRKCLYLKNRILRRKPRFYFPVVVCFRHRYLETIFATLNQFAQLADISTYTEIIKMIIDYVYNQIYSYNQIVAQMLHATSLILHVSNTKGLPKALRRFLCSQLSSPSNQRPTQ